MSQNVKNQGVNDNNLAARVMSPEYNMDLELRKYASSDEKSVIYNNYTHVNVSYNIEEIELKIDDVHQEDFVISESKYESYL